MSVAAIVYRLRMPEPHTHLFHVELRAESVSGPAELVMPSWTPGSYLMREFPRNVVSFAAEDGAGRALSFAKADKNTWRVAAPSDGRLTARYVVYADELTVRTSHLDATHAYVNGASVFMFPRGRESEPARVEIDAPRGWRVSTALPEDGSPDAFRAADYDELVDSPFEIGTHERLEFEVEGKRHRWAIWGRGNHDADRLVADATRVILAEKALFGTLPYPEYLFILHLISGGSGGLEHKNSTSLLADRWSFRGPAYENLQGLVAHEFFHLWNGKRIRPAALGPFDYTRENYTRDLWVVEGLTTYYTEVMLRRAGLMTQQRFLDKLADQVTRLQTTPGRLVQPLADASFDAWIKFYRPDANTPNATISYYQKGAMVGLLLDLRIRAATENRRSLDDVMRALWERFGARDVGYAEGAVEALASEVAGVDLAPDFDRWLRSTEELDFAAHLAAAGLVLAPAHEPRPGMPAFAVPAAEPGGGGARTEVRTGIQLKYEGGRMVIGHVLADTPAWRAGLSAGDEPVALDGLRVMGEALNARLAEKKTGERVSLTVFRRDELVTVELEVERAAPARLAIRPAESPTPEQRRVLEDWLRSDVPADAVSPPRG